MGKATGKVGDRVSVTLVGEIVAYDDDLGIWTLRGSAEPGHVTWDYHLHWATEFTQLGSQPQRVCSGVEGHAGGCPV